MSRQNLTALVGLAAFPLLAVAVAVYLVATNSLGAATVASAILVLGGGLFGVTVTMIFKFSQIEDWLWHQTGRIRDLSEKADTAATRIGELVGQSGQPNARLDAIMADVRALSDGLGKLIQRGAAPEAPKPEPLPTTEPPPRPAETSLPRIGGEHLELLLEPLIDLPTGATTHYRALLDLTDDQGHIVHHTELMQKADQGGMRPALDAHMVKQVAPVLRRLRVKNPGMRAIVPLGISTLGSGEETSRVVANLERDVDIAGGIVFEFDHRDLGRLDSSGIENLARLARLGATLALSNVQVAGLDLASLRQIGVRFLSFPPNAADSGIGPTTAWREFVQYARAMQFQIIVSDITTPQQATAANQIGRFGHGPFFAPPRKVKADAGANAQLRSAHLRSAYLRSADAA